VDITVYLPDEVGQRAKSAEPRINLSHLLREAVEEELDRREAVSKTLEGAEEITLDAVDDDWNSHTIRFTGKEIVRGQGYTLGHRYAGHAASYRLYLLEDERLLVYGEDDGSYAILDDPDGFRPDDDGEYVEMMRALGHKPVVDL
jgi:post-segregation antitoxin (ccd killing protein)